MKKLLADESVDSRIVKSLREDDYDIEAIVESNPGISDDEVLRIANELNAILLTEDKDFGELTYRLQKSSKGIILLRLSGESIADKIKKVKEVLLEYGDKLESKFTLVSIKKIRIKDIK